MATRIKLCGFTRPGDVRLACELGVDAIGMVFAHGSRRQVSLPLAERLQQAMAPLTSLVALFMNNPAGEVAAVTARLMPHLLQFHGNEEDAFCRSFGLPYIKAVALGGGRAPLDMAALIERWPNAVAFLLDGHAPGAAGGSGQPFDWSRLGERFNRPVMVAGGLDAGNVATLVQHYRPWAVDAASGVELAPGIKDGEKMRRFVAAVRKADNALLSGTTKPRQAGA